MRTALKPATLYWAHFNRFSLPVPSGAVEDIARPGQADDAVAYWEPRIAFPDDATPGAIRAELAEYGAWDTEELADDAANRRRIVWLACGNVGEDDAPEAIA